MKDWVERLDAFLTFNERDVLEGAGKLSKKQADVHAEAQYEAFTAPHPHGAHPPLHPWHA